MLIYVNKETGDTRQNDVVIRRASTCNSIIIAALENVEKIIIESSRVRWEIETFLAVGQGRGIYHLIKNFKVF